MPMSKSPEPVNLLHYTWQKELCNVIKDLEIITDFLCEPTSILVDKRVRQENRNSRQEGRSRGQDDVITGFEDERQATSQGMWESLQKLERETGSSLEPLEKNAAPPTP